MSFGMSSTTQSATSKNTIDIASFNNIMEEINKTWKDVSKQLEIVTNDIKELERMFNLYNNHDVLYQAKLYLNTKKEEIIQKKMFIETEIFNVKHKLVNI